MLTGKLKIKNLFWGIVGIILVGIGAGMLVKTGYGADTLNACFTGIAKKCGLSLGTINTIFNASMIILIFFVRRELVGIGMILSVFLLQLPIDLTISLYPASPNVFIGILSGILSLAVFSFGGSLMIESKMGSTVYDGLTLIMTDLLKQPFKIVRYFCDGTVLLIGFVLKGEIGVGTILSLLLMAPFIDLFRKIIGKYIITD